MLSGTRGVRMAAVEFPWALPSVHTPFIEKGARGDSLRFLIY